MRVLYIKSNHKSDEKSYSCRMAEAFIEEYKLCNPNHIVDKIDLYKEEFPHLSLENFIKSINKDGHMYDTLKHFMGYDKYIFSSPMWNLSVPSILKAYLDHIVIKGMSFNYSKYGMPIGLLKGKKAIYIGSRGGYYPFPISLITFDYKQVKYILKFIGIKDVKKFILQNTDRQPDKIKNNFPKTLNKIKYLAKDF